MRPVQAKNKKRAAACLCSALHVRVHDIRCCGGSGKKDDKKTANGPMGAKVNAGMLRRILDRKPVSGEKR